MQPRQARPRRKLIGGTVSFCPADHAARRVFQAGDRDVCRSARSALRELAQTQLRRRAYSAI
jgi:hypothetical protein